MESETPPCIVSRPAVAGTKRIPKACSSCRRSKVKCDGKRPCTRCDKLKKKCVFFEMPKDPVSERLANLEMEVQHLRTQLEEMHQFLRRDCTHPSPMSNDPPALDDNHGVLPSQFPSRLEQTSISLFQDIPHSLPWPAIGAPESEDTYPVKKRHSGVGICIPRDSVSDIVTRGLVTVEYAVLFFETFFKGCDRYIPIFDPEYDTFTSVRSRSSILFNAICTIGCRVATKAPRHTADILHADLTKSLSMVIQSDVMGSLESVQALLVAASYSAERSLILSFASRMALDRHMDEAFDRLMQDVPMKRAEGGHAILGTRTEDEDERSLMREARTWFGLLVLEHIFCVDGGKPPGNRLTEDARRCRILLNHSCSTVLDLRLFAQVELNVLRANINDTLSTGRDGSEITNFVQGAKIDLGLWFEDWLRIIENSPSANEEKPFLLVALHVQKCWAELVLQCKALQTMGIENIAAMSPPSRAILQDAKNTAQKHLFLITAKPNFYLAQLRYAMDFVWAKCAFCFLLLLKLSRLLPEPEQNEEHLELLERGEILLRELADAGPGSTNNIYLRILRVSIEKFGRTVRGNCVHDAGGRGDSGGARDSSARPFWEVFDAQTDLQAFVPKEFVSEWDFPGLNLFYFPTNWQDFFGDFSLTV